MSDSTVKGCYDSQSHALRQKCRPPGQLTPRGFHRCRRPGKSASMTATMEGAARRCQGARFGGRYGGIPYNDFTYIYGNPALGSPKTESPSGYGVRLLSGCRKTRGFESHLCR